MKIVSCLIFCEETVEHVKPTYKRICSEFLMKVFSCFVERKENT